MSSAGSEVPLSLAVTATEAADTQWEGLYVVIRMSSQDREALWLSVN